MKNKLFLSFVLAAFLFSLWTPPEPARAAQYAAEPTPLKLVINNKTGQTVQLKLTGPTLYYFTLEPGRSTHLVLPGKYQYSYTACQGKKTGTVVVSKNGTLLVLAACPSNAKPKAKEVKITINNQTGGTVWLNLTGPATYHFTLQSGRTVILMLKGKYTYTAWGCGGSSLSGSRTLSGGLVWRWYCRVR